VGNLSGIELLITVGMIGLPLLVVAVSLMIGRRRPTPGEDHVSDGKQVLAGWWQRAAAEVIDISIYTIAMVLLLTFFPELMNDIGVIVFVALTVLWPAFNWWYLQGTTGQTVGKKVMRIAVHNAGTSEPTGIPKAIGRYFARFLDAMPLYVGLLWPLWDDERRTFSDMVCFTRVHKVQT
jgi:uncharacterized RDD family membrane protein YckC